LQKIKEIKPNPAPLSVMSDFDKASLKAFREEFPNTEQRGCYFHFVQATHKRIMADGDLRSKLE
jgi:REP element-mobilizing transposase RayT